MTSKNHETGTNRCLEAFKHWSKEKNNDASIIINIQGDEPLLDTSHLNDIISCFKDPNTTIATLALKVKRNTLLKEGSVYLTKDDNDFALYFSRFPIPYLRDIPKDQWTNHHQYYQHIGIYGFTKESLADFSESSNSLLESSEKLEQLRWLEKGEKIKVATTEFFSQPVDTKEDLKIVRDYFNKKENWFYTFVKKQALKSKIKELIEKEIEAIQNIPIDGIIEPVIDIIHNRVHKKGGKLIISGMGKAGQIGMNIATTLSSTGTPSVFIHPSEAQHGDLGVVQKNDVLLLISNSGKTREILEFNYLVKRLHNNIPVISLSGNETSPLTDISDISLYTGNPKEICPLGLTPTTSTTVMTVVGDILVVGMMEKINFTKEEYAKRHHSGYLGQKAKEWKNLH